MRNDTRLVRIRDRELFVLNEPLRVVDVVLQVSDALVNLSLRLHNRLSHLLSHEAGVRVLVLREDLLEVAQLFKSASDARVTLGILVAEALIGAVNQTFKLLATHSLKRPVQFIVLGVQGTEDGTHRCNNEVYYN